MVADIKDRGLTWRAACPRHACAPAVCERMLGYRRTDRHAVWLAAVLVRLAHAHLPGASVVAVAMVPIPRALVVFVACLLVC